MRKLLVITLNFLQIGSASKDMCCFSKWLEMR